MPGDVSDLRITAVDDGTDDEGRLVIDQKQVAMLESTEDLIFLSDYAGAFYLSSEHSLYWLPFEINQIV